MSTIKTSSFAARRFTLSLLAASVTLAILPAHAVTVSGLVADGITASWDNETVNLSGNNAPGVMVRNGAQATLSRQLISRGA